MVNSEKYIKSIENLLNKNITKQKLIKAIESDFFNDKISEGLYKKAIDFLKMQENVQVQTTVYNSRKDAEEKLQVKIEGHKIDKIIGLENDR